MTSRRRKGPWAAALAAGALGLLAGIAACTEIEPVYACNEAGSTELYEKRIAPLLEDDRPKSCNQCHLSGVDLALFAKDTPCQTMACMVGEGVVDLDEPEASLLLQWIDRAAPESEGITESVLREERQGVLEWIEHSAACGLCADPASLACGDEGGKLTDCEVNSKSPPGYAEVDPGDCSDKTLELLFQNTFFPWRGRCHPCHFDGFEEQVPEAPKWIGVGACNPASLSTMRRVIEAGYVDTADPENSLLLTKPLEEELGGVFHEGGTKIHSKDEELYVRLLYWVTRYADCASGSPY